ncbi:MAG: tyrosine--tRNA ligase, partial [Candidatus Komeilibacteria bacterium]
MVINKDQDSIEEILSRGINEAINLRYLKEQLLAGKKLRVKLGIDPTSPNLHLGRAVTLLKLKDFQDLGHQIVFIVGDFTGTIGDTSDKESERPMLTQEVIKQNMKTYVRQISKIIDVRKVEIYYNSKWLKKLGFAEIGRMANLFSLAEFMARENIKKRYQAGQRVSLREVLYP